MSNGNRVKAGEVAGGLHKSTGYLVVQIYGRKYKAHIVVWAMMTGAWPERQIDHRDTDGSNNSQNGANKGLRKDSALGVKGVTKLPSWKYQAYIRKDGKQYCLGTRDTIEEAAELYWNAAQELHGEFARQDRRLTDEDHYDRIEQYRGRPTLAQLRERSKTWREVRGMIDWINGSPTR